MRRAALLLGFLAACSKDEPAPAPSPAPAPAADGAAATYEPAGERPVNPRRPTRPPGIETAALRVGATAPDLDLPATTGRFHLDDALSKEERVVVVFYRGDW